jgi:hypothetical protein
MRLVPTLMPRLLNFAVEHGTLRFADSAVRSREFRADQVLLVCEVGEELAFGWHLEFQAGDDRREFWRWIQKNAALNEQLKRPILLVVLYLQRGSAPDVCEIESGGIKNRHEFAAIRLWEYEARIRSGEFPELAPFLILWNHERGEQALNEQRDLLLNTALPQEILDDLIGWTMVVASRFFDSESVRTIFEKELKMLKDFPEVQQWIEEGREEGERRGDLRTARRICKHALSDRFGRLSAAAEEYLDLRTVDELDALVVRVHRASSLAELGIPT